MEKQPHKQAQPYSKLSHQVELFKPGHPIINNHDYLNFVKKNAKLM
jgi:hypothetical protein